MDDKKICFITCVTKERTYQECVFYIKNLNIPDGIKVEIMAVRNCLSITSGYNKVMNFVDAKYKVYIHENTFIINKNFIYDVLNTFSNSSIGMLGVVGFNEVLETNEWCNPKEKIGKLYHNYEGKINEYKYKDVEEEYTKVKFIDGLIMVTQYDVKWREDIFKSYYFYDTSQCMEFNNRGYNVVVCNQNKPWCIYECNITNKNENLIEDRLKFLKEYSSKRKILYVSHASNISGAPLLSLNIVKALKEEFDFEVHVMLMSGGCLEKEFLKYGTVYNIEDSVEKATEIVEMLYRYGVKMSICNTVLSGDIVKILNQAKFKVLSLVHELPWIIKLYNAETKSRNIANYSDKIVFASTYVKDRYQDILDVNIKNKSSIIPQGLYNENVINYNCKSDKINTKNLLKIDLGLKRENKILLGMGFGDERKGIDLFVNLAKQLYLEDRNIFFVWVGNIDINFIKLRCGDDFINNSNIIFTGSDMDVGRYFDLADLFLLTSREDPFPSVVLESMSLGTPVIGFKNAGGFVDVIKENETGFLAELENIDAMKNIILENIYNERKLEYMKYNCENLVNKSGKFDFSRYVLNLLKLLNC